MDLKTLKPRERKFNSKTFNDLRSTKVYIKHILTTNTGNLEVTALCKVARDDSLNTIDMRHSTERLVTYWKYLIGSKINFGFFYNPEIGQVFIVGPLIELFLLDMDGKKLAELSEGPYGILRGLGLSDTLAASHIKQMRHGSYLVLTRQDNANGYESEDL